MNAIFRLGNAPSRPNYEVQLTVLMPIESVIEGNKKNLFQGICPVGGLNQSAF
jgi:hypothetical protein